MLNQEAVKQFFLELYEEERNSQPEKSLDFFHGKKLSLSRERCGVYLYYQHLWLEEENKSQNVINESGFFIVNTMKDALWTMSYDGWHKKDRQVGFLGHSLLTESLKVNNSFARKTISGTTLDGRLSYEIEIDGRFQLLEIKILITWSNQCHPPVSYFTYRGRALVDLPS